MLCPSYSLLILLVRAPEPPYSCSTCTSSDFASLRDPFIVDKPGEREEEVEYNDDCCSDDTGKWEPLFEDCSIGSDFLDTEACDSDEKSTPSQKAKNRPNT